MSQTVLQVFENYQKSRVQFVQQVAELATRPQNVEAMQNAGVMALLRPLLLDNVRAYLDDCSMDDFMILFIYTDLNYFVLFLLDLTLHWVVISRYRAFNRVLHSLLAV